MGGRCPCQPVPAQRQQRETDPGLTIAGHAVSSVRSGGGGGIERILDYISGCIRAWRLPRTVPLRPAPSSGGPRANALDKSCSAECRNQSPAPAGTGMEESRALRQGVDTQSIARQQTAVLGQVTSVAGHTVGIKTRVPPALAPEPRATHGRQLALVEWPCMLPSTSSIQSLCELANACNSVVRTCITTLNIGKAFDALR